MPCGPFGMLHRDAECSRMQHEAGGKSVFPVLQPMVLRCSPSQLSILFVMTSVLVCICSTGQVDFDFIGPDPLQRSPTKFTAKTEDWNLHFCCSRAEGPFMSVKLESCPLSHRFFLLLLSLGCAIVQGRRRGKEKICHKPHSGQTSLGSMQSILSMSSPSWLWGFWQNALKLLGFFLHLRPVDNCTCLTSLTKRLFGSNIKVLGLFVQ